MGMPAGTQPPSGPLARAISAEIRAVMARHRVTTVLLAERTGISRSYIGKRLRDEASLTLNDIESICYAMREDLEGLICRACATLRPDDE